MSNAESPSATEMEPWLQLTPVDEADSNNSSHTARVTATVDQRMHRFEVEVSHADGADSIGEVVELDHQETVTERGSVETAPPSDDVYDLVASHEKVRDFVASNTVHQNSNGS